MTRAYGDRTALLLARDLDEVAIGIVQHGHGDDTRLERILREPNATCSEAIEPGRAVIDSD